MRNFQLVFLCFICVFNGYGQATTKSYGKIAVEITKEKHPKKIYAKVEIMLPFPGGDSSWVQSVEKDINRSLPFRNGAKKGKYIVSVQFVTDKNGSLSDIKCLSDPGFGMGQEVTRVLKKKAVWLPVPNGSPVGPYRK